MTLTVRQHHRDWLESGALGRADLPTWAQRVDEQLQDVERRVLTLTPRRRQVAHLISAGHSNKEIGRQLNLSADTIKDHVVQLFQVFGVRSRFELAALLRGDAAAYALNGGGERA